jgi:hypothetical protein
MHKKMRSVPARRRAVEGCIESPEGRHGVLQCGRDLVAPRHVAFDR